MNLLDFLIPQETRDGLRAKLARRIISETGYPTWVVYRAFSEIVRATQACRAGSGIYWVEGKPIVQELITLLLPLRQIAPPSGSLHAALNELLLKDGEHSICRRRVANHDFLALV